jgi:hypothetical protein
MGVVIGIIVLLAIGVVGARISNNRTRTRKVANSAVRQSLNASSARSVDEVRQAINSGLATVGLTEIGKFDNSQFYRVNSALQLELKVWPSEGHTLARLAVPSVRSVKGRPVKLSPVEPAISAAERALQRIDPQVKFT